MKLLFIGIGGAAGSILRYLLSVAIGNFTGNASFPFATLSINFIGSVVIGILFSIHQLNNFELNLKLFLFTGLLGGFTTFSAFSLETFILLKSQQTSMAIIYIVSSVFLCLAGVALGAFAVSK